MDLPKHVVVFQDYFTKWSLVHLVPDQKATGLVERKWFLPLKCQRLYCVTDGMVERFNWTLKAMPRKHVGHYDNQWGQYLARILLAYRNSPP